MMSTTYTDINKRRSGKWPAGLRLRFTFRDHVSWVSSIAWAPSGSLLASGSDDNMVKIWDANTGSLLNTFAGHDDTVFSVAWSPSGTILASGSDDETIICWKVSSGEEIIRLRGHTSGVVAVAWLPDEKTLVTGAGDRTIRFWKIPSGTLESELEAHAGWVRQLALSPDGNVLASASYDKTVKLWSVGSRELLQTFEGHRDAVHSVAWAPDGGSLASASKDMTVRIWESESGRTLAVLEGHTNAVYSLSYSRDGGLLATKSLDGTVRIWKSTAWEAPVTLNEESLVTYFGSLAFNPTRNALATLGEKDTVIRIWHYDPSVLCASPTQQTRRYTSAKMVLVGDSNVGKSCLALRLAEDRYEEQATTHGMRFWEVDPEQLDSTVATPPGETRDVVIWDMGGQGEYRLIHQIFLHDTTIALVLLDPTRGKTAFDDVEAWNRRLEKQLHGRRAVKLLVGTKLDDETAVVDRQAIERLKSDCGFAAFFPTSAKTGKGIAALRMAIAHSIAWDLLATTSRPELFQRVRDVIDAARASKEIVLLVPEISKRLEALEGDIEPETIGAVVEQLAMQGLVADTQLASGERALVLQVGEVERYAGSLILAATLNARGVPAFEERSIASSEMEFPRIEHSDRLPRLQERVVLECVVELLLRHGIALRHEGLLIFPALFSITERGEAPLSTLSSSLYYDFTGAIDNIYSALVARLAISESFGRYRLWEHRAEFESPGEGICGLRTVVHPTGVAHLDLYFSDDVKDARRNLFLVFVEDHLRIEGVEITEKTEMTCTCGVRFADEAIRLRLAGGHGDILCSVCERRTRITAGAKQARDNDSELENKLLALKTVIAMNSLNHVESAKRILRFSRPSEDVIRILHLSDLHMRHDSDTVTMFEQLMTDLKDPSNGLGLDRLDYLLVSGDLSSRGRPEEFERAYDLVSRVIGTFDLTAERCIIVPGNHDLDWDEPVYDWKPLRQVAEHDLAEGLREGRVVRQGSGVLVRNDKRYPLRLRNFNDKFYKFLTQEEYPLSFEEQCIPFLFTEPRLQILAVNSCWEIDEFYQARASIHALALSRGLLAAEEQIVQARKDNLLRDDEPILKIAVWHHPVNGDGGIKDHAFLRRLKRKGVRLCLHGHIHEIDIDLVGYADPLLRIYIASAGAFGAPASDRPEAIPRLYNVLEIKKDHSDIKVHTRCMRTATGVWEGWGVWDATESGSKQTYYKIPLNT